MFPEPKCKCDSAFTCGYCLNQTAARNYADRTTPPARGETWEENQQAFERRLKGKQQ